MILLPTLLCAAEGEAVHDFLRDPVEELLEKLMLGAVILTIIVSAYSLFRYRGKTHGRTAWAVLISAIAVLPALSIAFGMLMVLEKAEKNQFCASCHLTMQVYLDDMEDAQSESLAAVHFKNRYIPKNQCYECHTSYGMHGTVEAKQKGLMDVYKYYTRTYKIPIEMRSPYPNGDCLKCHAESALWQAQELHLENKEALFGEEMSCMDCHGAMGHPAHIFPEPEEAD